MLGGLLFTVLAEFPSRNKRARHSRVRCLMECRRARTRMGDNFKRSTVRYLRIALLFAVSILMSACGNSNSSVSSTPGTLSGNWQMSLLPTGKTLARRQSGFLIQNGSAVTGGMMLLNNPCSGTGGVTGTVNGAGVALNVNPTGVNVTLTGTLGSDQQSMSGSYVLLATGCTGTTAAPET